MEHVKTLDAAWLHVESEQTPMHVGCLQIFKLPRGAGSRYVRKLVDAARANTQLSPPFSLKVHHSPIGRVLPSWEEEPDPDMAHHVPLHALPSPGGARELDDLVAGLQSDELEMTRPLWECHFIEGLSGRRFALFTKIHHSLLDGIGGMRLLEAMLSTDPKARDVSPPWTVHARRKHAKQLDDAGPDAARTVEHLLQLAATQMHALPGLYRAARAFGKAAMHPETSPLSAPYTAPKSVLNGHVSPHHRLVTMDLSLARMRRMAQRAGVTINDVFMALCSGALRRYLKELDALPEQPLVAGLPVSIRPAGDTSIGTLVTFILSSLSTDLDDPLQRLAAIHKATRAAKDHLQKLERTALTEYTLLLMAPFIIKLMTGLGAAGHPVFNVVVSNVPGPDHPLYYNGARLEAMYPTSIVTHGQALNITGISYAGRFNIGMTACSESVPHAERLAEFASAACDELERRLAKATPRRSTRQASKRSITGNRTSTL